MLSPQIFIVYLLIVVEWPFRDKGAERIYTALVKVGFFITKYIYIYNIYIFCDVGRFVKGNE